MDQNDNKESSLVVATTQPPEQPAQPQNKKAVIFPPPSITQLDETDGGIAVEPTVCQFHLGSRSIDHDDNVHHQYFLFAALVA